MYKEKYCNYIYLHIIGEPLLHPDFNEILDILDRYDMHLQLVTNGTLLNRYPDLLRHSCLRKLSISLHSINNIDKLRDRKHKRGMYWKGDINHGR